MRLCIARITRRNLRAMQDRTVIEGNEPQKKMVPLNYEHVTPLNTHDAFCYLYHGPSLRYRIFREISGLRLLQ